jgi:hypothetical protein
MASLAELQAEHAKLNTRVLRLEAQLSKVATESAD